MYFDTLNDIVGEHNNEYHKTIKMKPADVKNDSFAEYNEDSNEKDLKFKVNDHIRISKYKNIFAKWHAPNWSEEIFVVKKKNTAQWALHVESTSILSRYVEDQILTNFHVISTYFFDVISMVEISTFFPTCFFSM